MLIGLLGNAYLWVKAGHIIFVIFWMAGMFMLPRYLVYQHEAAVGSEEDARWAERTRRLRTIIITPAMLLAWLFGLMLAANIGFAGNAWLWAKLAVVTLFSGLHGWLVVLSKRMAAGAPRERAVTIHDIDSGELLHRFEGLGGGASEVRFSPSGALLAGAHGDSRVRIWHVRSGALDNEIDTGAAANATAFMPFGKAPWRFTAVRSSTSAR